MQTGYSTTNTLYTSRQDGVVVFILCPAFRVFEKVGRRLVYGESAPISVQSTASKRDQHTLSTCRTTLLRGLLQAHERRHGSSELWSDL